MEYEFEDKDANVLKNVGNKFIIFSSILMVTGIMSLTSYLLSGNSPLSNDFEMIIYLALFISGVVLYRPSDNLINIANTEGRDINELMEAIKEFSFAFLVTGIMFIIIGFQGVYQTFSS